MATVTEMKVSREDLNKCTIKLDIVCTPDQIKAGFDKAYRQYGKQVRVPGFRPGHAPRHILEKVASPEQLAEHAAELIINDAMPKLLQQEKIQPHDVPAVSVTKFEIATNELEFTAKVPLKPIVELGEYKGLPVTKEAIDVTDEEVTEQLEELRRRQGKRELITDRGAEEGDVAIVNIKGEKEEGEGKNMMVRVGSTFDAMDKAVKGMRSEEMKNVSLDFPKEFQNAEFAGTKGKFKLTLKSLNSVVLPDADDEFARSLQGDLASLKNDSIDGLKATLKGRIESAKLQMAQEMVNESLQEELVKRSTIEVPDTMWEAVATQRLNELAQEARSKGQTIEDYAKANGMTVDEMVKAWQIEAQVQVKRAVAAREIFDREKMQLTNADMTQMLYVMAYEYGTDPQYLLDLMKKNKNFRELEIRAVFKKVIDFLNQHAEVSEGGAPKAKAPAKKAAAKAEAKEEAPKEEKPKKAPAKKK